jgi:hypothetical protein
MRSKPPFESEVAWAAFHAAHDWPLPREPYLPGITQRPGGDDDVHRVAAMAPDPTNPKAWRENAAYLAGFRLYEAGFGWEAHEVWEPVWMHATPHSAERYLLQGLIQLANARLKFAMDRDRAGQRLLQIASGLLEEASFAAEPKVLMGVNVKTLLSDVRSAQFNGHSKIIVHYNA